jgi:hypothetical protein
MASQFTEPHAGPLPSGCGGRAQDFPHGLITPPEPAHAIVQREKAKAAEAVAFAEEAWQRMTDELTLQYYLSPPVMMFSTAAPHRDPKCWRSDLTRSRLSPRTSRSKNN